MVRALPFLLLWGTFAHAADLCRNGLFADDQDALHSGRITGDTPVSLYQDSSPGCPEKGAACREREVAPPSGEVLVSKTRSGFACVWISHDLVGWVPAARVDASAPTDARPPLTAWAGDWVFFDNHIRISGAPDGRLHVAGQAFWHGLNQNVHEGSIESDAAPSGNHLAFQQSGCSVKLTLVDRRLIASDSRNCGGANVTFTGVYEQAHEAFRALGQSSLKYGRTSDGAESVDITNVSFELAQIADNHRLVLRKTHSEKNVVGDEGNDPKIAVEAWPLGVSLSENPIYRVELSGQDATMLDDALLIFDRTEEIPWWSVYKLASGEHFFDTYAPLLRFSITDLEQTERYAALEISHDDTADKRLKAKGVVGVLRYASGDRIIREALITADSADRAELLHSLADTTFELSYTAKSVRVSFTPFRSPATVITVPVLNDDLDLAHARIPPGIHLAPWKR